MAAAAVMSTVAGRIPLKTSCDREIGFDQVDRVKKRLAEPSSSLLNRAIFARDTPPQAVRLSYPLAPPDDLGHVSANFGAPFPRAVVRPPACISALKFAPLTSGYTTTHIAVDLQLFGSGPPDSRYLTVQHGMVMASLGQYL
jgi:hypothetical protein